ncbi:MAG: hypothetical protein HYS70_07015 [Nitrospinae bacterium]|nr:hypothetical protein [Nitrospinota bacterium]
MEERQPQERGSTLAEVFISLAITGIILAAVYALFISQNKSYIAQQDVIQLLQDSQNATNVLAKDLRMAGYGVPVATYPGNPCLGNPDNSCRITAASATSLTTNGNFRRVSPTLREFAASGQATLQVQSITGFAVGDTIWITNGTNSEPKTISGITGGGSPSLTVNANLSNSYNAGSTVHQSRTITYTYANGTLSRTMGGVQQTLVQNVTAFSFTYTYSGAVSLTNIRQIMASLTVQTAKALPDTGKKRTVTFQTIVAPQNLAF